MRRPSVSVQGRTSRRSGLTDRTAVGLFSGHSIVVYRQAFLNDGGDQGGTTVDHQSNAEQRSIDPLNCHFLLASRHVGLVVPGKSPSVVALNSVVVDEVVYF
jgi:hypothetical protein